MWSFSTYIRCLIIKPGEIAFACLLSFKHFYKIFFELEFHVPFLRDYLLLCSNATLPCQLFSSPQISVFTEIYQSPPYIVYLAFFIVTLTLNSYNGKKKYIWIFVFPKLFIPSPIRIGEGRKLYLCSHLAILKLVRFSYPMCDEQNSTGEGGQADRVPAGASSRLPGLPGLNSQPQPQLSVGAVPGRQWQWHSSTGSQQPHGTHGLSCQFLAFSCPVLGHWDLWNDLVGWRGDPSPK